jgi:hypothetical protein
VTLKTHTQGLVAEFLHTYEWRKYEHNGGEETTFLFYGKWMSHALGWVALIPIYFVLFWQLKMNADDVDMPKWVWGIVVGEFLMFNSFGVVQFLQFCYILSPTATEMLYVILSLSSKSLLGWMLYSQVLI